MGSSANKLTPAIKNLEDEKDYSAAIEKLKVMQNSELLYNRAQLLIGHALFQRGMSENNAADLEEAIRYYQKVLALQPDYELKSEAEWYTLLVQLKNKQTDQAFLEKLKTIVCRQRSRLSASCSEHVKRNE